MISETALQAFKKIWAEEFDEEISDEKATELGANLLSLFNHIYHPVKRGWLAVSDDEKSLEKNKNEIVRTEV